MTLLRLKRLPTPTDLNILGCIGLTQFIEQFNACALDAVTARIDLLHGGLTVALGGIAWEHVDNAWYVIESNATSHRVSHENRAPLDSPREILTTIRSDHPNHVEFTIESAPSTSVLKLQCFVALHHAERLAERIRELTRKGYFDTHPRAIDKLAQVCDVLLVGDRLVKCRMTLSRLVAAHYATSSVESAELEAIISAMEAQEVYNT